MTTSTEHTTALLLLCTRLTKLMKQAEALGLFTGNRELLECTNCGLVEDVLFDGRLVTYRKVAENIVDSGLRFEPTLDEAYICPNCFELVEVEEG